MKFRMSKITVDQFAILLKEIPTGEINLNIELNMKYSVESRRIMTSMLFRFEKDSQTALLLEQSCEFEIAKDDWDASISNGKVTIPKSTIEYFGAQTIGVARGVLHCKTEGSQFNGFILPPINITQLIKEDMIIEL